MLRASYPRLAHFLLAPKTLRGKMFEWAGYLSARSKRRINFRNPIRKPSERCFWRRLSLGDAGTSCFRGRPLSSKKWHGKLWMSISLEKRRLSIQRSCEVAYQRRFSEDIYVARS